MGSNPLSFCETPLPASYYLALSAVGWGREELVAFYIQYYQYVMWALQLKAEIGFVSVNGGSRLIPLPGRLSGTGTPARPGTPFYGVRGPRGDNAAAAGRAGRRVQCRR